MSACPREKRSAHALAFTHPTAAVRSRTTLSTRHPCTPPRTDKVTGVFYLNTLMAFPFYEISGEFADKGLLLMDMCVHEGACTFI
jgi:hypothetical protein